jgi:hypothetical protein
MLYCSEISTHYFNCPEMIWLVCLTKHYSGNKIEGEIGGVCDMYGRQERCI